MKLQMFCVFDSKVEAYMQPFYARTVGEALRSWEQSCNDGQSMMSRHPGDYTLFQVGEFDDQTGRIHAKEAFTNLGTAIEQKRAPKEEIPLPFGKATGTIQEVRDAFRSK